MGKYSLSAPRFGGFFHESVTKQQPKSRPRPIRQSNS